MYSVIVPVYNSEKTLPELCSRTISALEEFESDYEIILVNDCSKDKSWEVLKELHLKNNMIKVINLSKNYGQHAALMCGLKYAIGDVVVTIDDDLQHPPEEIPKMIKYLKNNPEIDVVIGSYMKKQHSLWRNAGSIVMKFLSQKTIKQETNFKLTSFRAIRGKVAKTISSIHIQKPRIGTLILHTTQKIATIMVEHNAREYGQSGYTFKKLFHDLVNNVISNSTLPLKLISILGFWISFFSMIFIVYIIGKYFLFGTSVKGWSSLTVMITFFSGLILFTLGIIGEYLLLILLETRKLPIFIEREKHL